MPNSRVIPKNVFWILLPALLWIGLFLLRPILYHPWCAVQPSPCLPSSVNQLDQLVFQFDSVFADFLSNLLQNAVGVVLFLVPLFALQAVKSIVQTECFFVLGTLWNGALLELGRAFAQRPRPLVMNNPMGDGAQIGQYTSFYSGHTSFVAFATLTLVLWTERHYGKGSPWARLALGSWMGLTTLTAVLRILGGRHYPTDTLAGAFAGSLIALVMWRGFSHSFEEDPI